MATVQAGVVTAAEVNGPINGGPVGMRFSLKSASTWAVIWFAIALFMLFVVL